MLLKSHGLLGVFVGAHAVAAGVLTRHELNASAYRRILHGVYANPALPRDHVLRCRAAALLMPPRAVLGGRSAAAVLGAAAPDYRDPVTVLLPSGVTWLGPKGVRVHHTDVGESAVITGDDGLRWTDPVRTAWDVAAFESIRQAVGVLDAMLRAGLVTEQDLAGLLVQRRGRRWSQRVKKAFDLTDRRAMSPPESWVRVECTLAHLPPPIPQFPVFDGGRWLGDVDLAWPDHKLIVEYEGEYHFDGLQIVKDDARYARMVAAGWRVIRLSSADLRDLDAVVARIAAALAVPPQAA